MENLDQTKIQPWPELQAKLPKLSIGEREALIESIEDRKVNASPILALPDGRIIDGHHRWELSDGDWPVKILELDEESALSLGIALNCARRQMSPEQLKETREWNIRRAIELRAQGKTQAKVAEELDVNQSTVSDWERDKSNMEPHNAFIPSAPDLRMTIPKIERDAIYARCEAGETQAQVAADYKVSQQRIGQIARQVKARQRQPETVETPASPTEKYRCLVIDPPWPARKIEREMRPNQGVALDYPTMSLEQIASLPVSEWWDVGGCHVYLWTTHRFLPEALNIMARWEVKYQCLLTWIKNVGFTPFSWMYSTEHVLFGRVGNLPLLKLGLRLDFKGKVREHSRKPNEFYELVKQASPEKRLDAFSRERREGFAQWGNEIDVFSS